MSRPITIITKTTITITITITTTITITITIFIKKLNETLPTITTKQ